MKIVVVSDTHGTRDFIQNILNKESDANLYLHAGDSELPENLIFPFQTVKGNCDYYIKNRVKITNVLGVGIYMLHGDHTILSDKYLSTLAKGENCQIIIHGHTHKPYYSFYEGVHIVCPGSTAYPRSSEATYALITFSGYNSDEKRIVDFKIEFKKY